MTTRTDNALSPEGLTACHECDRIHRLHPLAPDEKALCVRCGALLYRDTSRLLDRCLALSLAALGLFTLANVFPFIALKIEGRIEVNLVVSGSVALWKHGMPELGVLVFLTSVLFPLIIIAGLLWILVPLKLGFRAPGTTAVYRVIHAIGPWSLLGVFMLGVLIAFVKLLDIASVLPGVSMFAFAALLLVATAAASSFDAGLLWPRTGPTVDAPGDAETAKDLGLTRCHTCELLVSSPEPGAHARCPRCESPLHGERKHDSIARTWALIFAATMLIIPANLYPVMTVIRFGRGEPSTILSGVVHLVEEGMWGLALIVFVASIVVPVIKLLLLIYLLISVQSRSEWRPKDRTRLYRITEVVGAWSMVDIFLVGILSALVNLQALATIEPGIGASYFGAVVVITMFAAHSFDPRLIWDHAERRE